MNREQKSMADGPGAAGTFGDGHFGDGHFGDGHFGDGHFGDGTGGDGTGGDGTGPSKLAAQFDAWLMLTGQSPAPAGLVHLPMLSGSMSPALPPGCTLEIDPRTPHGFAPGEVVVLALDGRLVAHRVLLRVRWWGQVRLLEMGDANPRGAWRSARSVVGRVVGATTFAGAPLPAPTSRRQARRGLLRYLRGLWLPAPGPVVSLPSDGKSKDDD